MLLVADSSVVPAALLTCLNPPLLPLLYAVLTRTVLHDYCACCRSVPCLHIMLAYYFLLLVQCILYTQAGQARVTQIQSFGFARLSTAATADVCDGKPMLFES